MNIPEVKIVTIEKSGFSGKNLWEFDTFQTAASAPKLIISKTQGWDEFNRIMLACDTGYYAAHSDARYKNLSEVETLRYMLYRKSVECDSVRSTLVN